MIEGGCMGWSTGKGGYTTGPKVKEVDSQPQYGFV